MELAVLSVTLVIALSVLLLLPALSVEPILLSAPISKLVLLLLIYRTV